MVSLPVELVRSTPPNARQWTRTPSSASFATVLQQDLGIGRQTSSVGACPSNTSSELPRRVSADRALKVRLTQPSRYVPHVAGRAMETVGGGKQSA
jgi:hypothetical protein